MPPELLEGAGNGPDIAKELPIAADTVVSAPAVARDDIDDLDLEALRQAAKAEEHGGSAEATETQTQAQPGTVAPQQDQTPQPERPATISIPKPRFDQVLREKQALEAEVARKDGELIALRSKVPAPAPVVPPRIAELNAGIAELARKFDAGELSAYEWETQKQAMQSERESLREAELLNRISAQRQPQPTAQPSQDDLYLEDKTNEIQAKYGSYIDAIPAPYFDNVVAQARAELEAEGVAMRGTKATYLLRERIGVLAQEQGPALVQAYERTQARLAGQPAAAPAATRVQQPTAGPTPAQRAAKLNMQAEMPPNIGSMTRSADLNDAPSEADIEGMSEEEISSLPASIRNRLLGYTT